MNSYNMTKTFNSLINDFEYIEFNLQTCEGYGKNKFFANVLNDGCEVSYLFTDNYEQAKGFIQGALFTLDGLGIIDKTKELNR